MKRYSYQYISTSSSAPSQNNNLKDHNQKQNPHQLILNMPPKLEDLPSKNANNNHNNVNQNMIQDVNKNINQNINQYIHNHDDKQQQKIQKQLYNKLNEFFLTTQITKYDDKIIAKSCRPKSKKYVSLCLLHVHNYYCI